MSEMNDERKSKLLVVDDTVRNLHVLVELLRGDYEINVANNGQDALDLAAKIKFDLMLLDIKMPGMDGFEVCKTLNSSQPELPIIFLSAQNDHEFIAEGFEVGAVDYVTKPFNQYELKARINTHLDLNFYKRQVLELQRKVEHYELQRKQ